MILKIKNAFKTLKSEKLILFVYVLLIGVFVILPFDVFAADPFTKLIGKFDGVKDTVVSIAKILAVIGIIIGGIKKVLGHPDSWNWLWKSSLGAFIIFSADAIITWLSA